MLVCGYRFGFKSPLSNFPRSLGTLAEHLPTPNLKRPPVRFSASVAPIKAFSSTAHIESLTSRQKDQLHLYVDALLEWNQKMNLTAVTDANEAMERHVEDSLAMIAPICDSYALHCKSSVENLSLVDVGSGAGLPGLILAIAHPGWKVTLMESMNKRCTFLDHAVNVTELTNVEVVRGRAEDLGQNLSFRETFDVAVARAVAEMRILVEYCLPLVRVGGLFVAAKGHDPQVEVEAAERSIQLMGASLLELCKVESHSPHGQRTAIICTKNRPTPKRYPRPPDEACLWIIENPLWGVHVDQSTFADISALLTCVTSLLINVAYCVTLALSSAWCGLIEPGGFFRPVKIF